MDRRAFLATLTGSLLAAPLAAEGQQAAKGYRIAMVNSGAPANVGAPEVGEAFRRGLREFGYVEGQNITIEYRGAELRAERFPGIMAELVRLAVDVIALPCGSALDAARQATRTIPLVVMACNDDLLRNGIVASLARPGGNVTGLSSGITESFPKRVELLAELLPGLKRIVAILNMGNPVVPPQWDVVEASAHSLRIEPHLLDVRRPEDLQGAFDEAAKRRAEALVVGLDGVTQANLRSIAELAAKQRLPSIYPAKDYAKLGGLMTYGSSDFHMYRRAAGFVDKIFKGAKPADLPVEQPTEWEFVINLKTAKALGLTIPQSLLQRADQVIE